MKKTNKQHKIKTGQKKNSNSGLYFALGIVVVVILFFVAISYFAGDNKPESFESMNQNVSIDVESFASEGSGHTADKVTYKTFPPTSGDHNPAPARYGFYQEAPPFENLVHSMEHGDIIIYYDPSGISDAQLTELKGLSKFTYEGSGTQVVPNTAIESPIVMTAWTKMMKLAVYDIKKMKQFIYDHMFRGPEKLPPQNMIPQ